MTDVGSTRFTLSPGQKQAIEELRAIERLDSGALQLVSEPGFTESGMLHVAISMSCAGLRRVVGGLPLREREVFVLFVPPGFPFAVPVVQTRHARFDGFEHVQWRRQLCLYQAPATEWDASDGIYGFIDRLFEWLRLGAANEFEPAGAPLHPPVAYVRSADDELVIPRQNTPAVAGGAWLGTAELDVRHPKRRDIVRWIALDAADESTPPRPPAPSEGAVASRTDMGAAILLAEKMPFEYPDTVGGLVGALAERNVPRRLMFLCLLNAALRAPDGSPLYVIVGAPMRGVSGSEDRQQHLAVWRLDDVVADALRLAAAQFSDNAEIRAIGESMEAAIHKWADAATMTWVSVREARPEVTRRRDEGTPITWFSGRRVSIWGCGALGAQVAELLARAGVKQLVLRDSAAVAPGVLVRQPFVDGDIGRAKVEAVAARVRQIDERIDVVQAASNVLTHPLDDADWTDGADVVIDATASASVLDKIELRRVDGHVASAVVVSMVVDHRAERGLVVAARPEHSGGPLDVVRRAKLEACRRPKLRHFADAFWPVGNRHPLFQPEPGCSENTFVGSAADLMILAASMLNVVARGLAADAHGSTGSAHLIAAPHVDVRDGERVWTSTCVPDVVCVDPETSYQIRISQDAWGDVLAWVARGRRVLGARVETGGVLFGERNDAARVIWVSEVLGPPPDSSSAPEGFICGTAGVSSANEEKRVRTRGSVVFVGMWHTHPTSDPLPSATDLQGMAEITAGRESRTPKAVLVIVGRTVNRHPMIATYLFRREEFVARGAGLRGGGGKLQRTSDSSETARSGAPTYARACAVRRAPLQRRQNRVGLALSGGGARAIAFHLGCLRALNDGGVLDQVVVLSAVSGGSVIGALYAYGLPGLESFQEFDAGVVRLLRKGLARSIVRRTLLSPATVGALATLTTAGVAAIGADALRFVAGSIAASKNGDAVPRVRRLQPPLRRWWSRADALVSALRDELFGSMGLSSATRNNMAVVFNATELRTGTAFRFANEHSGSSRFGRVDSSNVDVALAVAASAAYPALVPALDLSLPFLRSDGSHRTDRVLLTDGGVYDNLGTGCMEPGRTHGASQHVYDPDFIIACDAGVGVVDGVDVPYWWPTRMVAAFGTEFRRVQNDTRNRLHSLASSGRLDGFVLSYLGQDDRRLPWVPADLIARDRVVNYPTNFDAMPDEMISQIAGRGEQLTRILLTHYLPEL